MNMTYSSWRSSSSSSSSFHPMKETLGLNCVRVCRGFTAAAAVVVVVVVVVVGCVRRVSFILPLMMATIMVVYVDMHVSR